MRLPTLVIAINLVAIGSIAPAMEQSPRANSKDDPNRLICRSTVATGTLARRERRCFTRTQWEEFAARNQRVGFELQEGLRGKPCGDPAAGC